MKSIFKACCLTAIVCCFGLSVTALGQTYPQVRRKVLNHLVSLKPKNRSYERYIVKVPAKLRSLPDDQKVDLVYKIGHYEFQYVALRFERRSSSDKVDVTYFSYGSALDFWKKFEKTEDSVSFKRGTLSKTEFDKLMTEAVTYADSNIESIPVIRKIRQKDGTWYYGGRGGGSHTANSGDGSILFGLSNSETGDKVITDSGSLVGDVSSRKENGYDFLRPNLVWEVLTDSLPSKISFVQMRKDEAEDSAIERLEEAPLSNDYKDYFRQALFVQVLARVGTEKSIAVLKKISSSNGLEPDWNKYLSDEALWAVEQITARTKQIISSTRPQSSVSLSPSDTKF